MSSKIEKVARAICFRRCQAGEFIDPENGCVGSCKDPSECPYWETAFVEDARAAIEAMRPLTPEMIHAAAMAVIDDGRPDFIGDKSAVTVSARLSYDEAAAVVEAALDAALTEDQA